MIFPLASFILSFQEVDNKGQSVCRFLVLDDHVTCPIGAPGEEIWLGELYGETKQSMQQFWNNSRTLKALKPQISFVSNF